MLRDADFRGEALVLVLDLLAGGNRLLINQTKIVCLNHFSNNVCFTLFLLNSVEVFSKLLTTKIRIVKKVLNNLGHKYEILSSVLVDINNQ